MSQEVLNLVNENSSEFDEFSSKNIRGMALAFASLNSLGDLVLESKISNTYNGINTGFGVLLNDKDALNLYRNNLKNSPTSSLIFSGYLGLDNIINAALSNVDALGSSALTSLKASINALFLSCSLYKVSYVQVRNLLIKTFAYYAQNYPSAAYQLNISLFPDLVIQSILGQDYSVIFSSINNSSPKSLEEDVYSYNFYDTTKIFSESIDYQVMADSEVQYYYISGQFIYDQDDVTVNPCIKISAQDSSNNTYQIYQNLPCVDLDNSAAPINGLSFYRKFPDGPNSSGAQDLSEIYQAFNISANPDFYNYSTTLYSDPSLTLKLGDIPSDLTIYGSINDTEIAQVPQPPKDNPTGYSSSHIGGNSPRWRITGYIPHIYPLSPTPMYGFIPMTGFKIIPLSLNKDVWGNTYNSIRTNPDTSLDLKLIRALNTIDHLSSGNLGGPIVSNNTFQIPCLLLNEEFSNKTMGVSQSGNFYFGVVESSYSTDGLLRPIVRGKFITGINGNIFDAGMTGDSTKIKFSFPVYNNQLTGNNAELAGRCFGMGDAGGSLTVSGVNTGNNLGYSYSEFSVISGAGSNTIVLPSSEFFKLGNLGIIGNNGSSTIGYIDGFTSVFPSKTQKVYGYNQTGGLFTYNYFYPGSQYGSNTIPLGDSGSDINRIGSWGGIPFPIPKGAESLTPVIVSQKKENYLPRFYKGPYSSKRKPFLYPSASGVDKIYPSGFPIELEINLSISEEIARKIVQQKDYWYLGGAIQNKITNLSNEVFDKASLNFNSDLPFADSYQGQIGSLKTYIPPEDYLVSNYWVDNSFIDFSFQGSGSIKNLYTGACINSTGIVASLTLNTVNKSIFNFGTFSSGFYVTEYDSGYYSLPASPNKLIDGPNDEGYYLIYSNNQIDKLFNLASHKSFYHTGGSIKVSGQFSSAYTGIPIKIHLEKDCSLCADFYLKYGLGSEINDAGCKYNKVRNNIGFNVYPSGTTSTRQIFNSAPDLINDFKKGVRLYADNFIIGGPSDYVTTYELIKIKTGALASQYYYKEMPLFDTNSEFHYQTGRNFTLNLKYTLPEYSLFDRLSHPEYADSIFQSLIADCVGNSNLGSPVQGFSTSPNLLINKNNSQIVDGADPIWFEKLGGNSGISGGYHSKGLLGDAWIGFSADSYGITPLCDGINVTGYSRTPKDDNYVFELNSRFGTELSLHTRALNFSPGYFERRVISNVNPWISNFEEYDLTGIEKYNQMANSSFDIKSLLTSYISTGFEQYSYLYSDYLYPMPGSLGDLYNPASIRYTGSLNEIKSSGIYSYWISYLKSKKDPSFILSSYKYLDKARVNFKINSVKITKYGEQPLDIDQSLKFSGKCIVSGEFGYDSQAESSIFTEGVFLQDNSQNYPLTEFYMPNYVSDVMTRLPLFKSGTASAPIEYAPSRCVTRKNISKIYPSGNQYIPLLTESPYFYNKFIVSAMSDFSFLNDGTDEAGFEKTLTNDGFIYPQSTFLLNASLAQHKNTPYEAFLDIPNSPKIYYVEDIKQFFDSSVTDSAINSGYFITSTRGPQVQLTQDIDSSGFLAPNGATYKKYKLGIYSPADYSDYQA